MHQLSSDRKQRCQELELPVVPLLERSSAGRTWVSLECSDFEKQRENSGKQDGEEDWILEYDSPSDNDDIPSLEREADFTSEEVPASEKCSLEEQNCVQLICFYLRCYGTTGLPWPFVFYPLFAFGFRFFDTDLPIPIRFSVIEV